jgi:hypothetical protein
MGKITEMKPGSVHGLHLVVADIQQARNALVGRGIDVKPVSDVGGVLYAAFSDPDGNTWLLQKFPPALRRPGQSFHESKAQATAKRGAGVMRNAAPPIGSIRAARRGRTGRTGRA